MKTFLRLPLFALLSLALAFSSAGCKSNQSPANTANPQDTSQDQSYQDPASANVAPISNASTQSSQAPAQGGSPDQGVPSSGQYASNQGGDDSDYGEQPVDYAPQPPPPLPQYDQPDCPGEGYIWTPGYWN